ncbi:hypothetical protein CQW23_16338 [Capsicum baccatum]|uniref:Uncharacterized protein n=1 Tax=Capsicum baccatum TaxID=33114 RepID=A0A2G2WAN4_CAPBA|nr:hypothetical protein CQW23_16338 [Capsicum baccatum]PHU10915.1 hypothetical protein BC332_17845 [Capsicum chinense]
MNILFHPLTPLILWNTSIDPTKIPDPPIPSYTLTIYNLYLFEKSKFKDYDSLLGIRFAGYQARANHLASVLENGDAISANGILVRPHDEHESKVANEKDLASNARIGALTNSYHMSQGPLRWKHSQQNFSIPRVEP